MGAFYVNCKIVNIHFPRKSTLITKVLVDTGAEYSWIPQESLERIGVVRKKGIDNLYIRQ